MSAMKKLRKEVELEEVALISHDLEPNIFASVSDDDIVDVAKIAKLETEGKAEQEDVCGPDERIVVSNVTVTPHNAICKLYMTFANGVRSAGSGTFVAGNKILTAGHCVYDHSLGAATSIIVQPARNGSNVPFQFAATKTAWLNGWTSSDPETRRRYDIGIIKIAQTYTHTVPMQSFDLTVATVCGYPRYEGVRQFMMTGRVQLIKGRYFYQIDSEGGQSGGYVGDGKSVMGVHNYGGCPNSASDLDDTIIRSLANWQ